MNYRSQIIGWLLLLALACLVSCSDRPVVDAESTAESAASATSTTADEPSGSDLFMERCAACHTDSDNKRAIQLQAMTKLNPAHVVFALTNGSMKMQAEGLRIDQLMELAQFISGERETYQPAAAHFCPDTSIDANPIIARWAIDENSTAFLPADTTTIDSGNVDRLELAWAFGLPDVANARSQPVITEDTLFIAATSGHLFALDRFSGCIRWHVALTAPPRTALTLGSATESSVLFFGDIEAHVNAIDLQTGKLIWRVDATISEHTMLTGAQIQHGNRLIVPVSLYEVGLATNPEYECCKSHGGVIALDAATGERLWTAHMTAEAEPQELTDAGTRSWGPSGAPVWSTPTVDGKRGLVYVGTGQNASLPATGTSDAVVALDLATGAKVWHFQAIAGDAYNMACDQQPPGPNCPKWRGPDHDIGAAVVLTKNSEGQDRLIVGQKSGDLYALDPDDSGTMLWQKKVGAGSPLGGVHWGLAVADGTIFAPIADPPYPIPGYRPVPGLYALTVDDGDFVWKAPIERGCETNLFEYFGRDDLYPECSFYYGLSAAPVVANDLIFAPALDGTLRAFSRDDGSVLWSVETARPFETINEIEAHGGSIDVAGAHPAGSMLYVQSGYGQFGQLPGNVLLAFQLPQ